MGLVRERIAKYLIRVSTDGSLECEDRGAWAFCSTVPKRRTPSIVQWGSATSHTQATLTLFPIVAEDVSGGKH